MIVDINIWSILFIASIGQAVFLIPMLIYKSKLNKPASLCLVSLLTALILTNLDYLLISSGLYNEFPSFFGMSNGLMLLIGPLSFFYAKSILKPSFQFRPLHLLHAIPYGLNAIFVIPLFLLDTQSKITFIELFMTGNLPLRNIDIALLSFQILHLSLYLGFIFNLIYTSLERVKNTAVENYHISLSSRIFWLKVLAGCFCMFELIVLGDFIYMLSISAYNVVANYLYTLIMSVIIYVIAYQAVLKMDVMMAGFSKKYSNLSMTPDEVQLSLDELSELIKHQKPYLNPDLKLEDLADLIDISSHQLSRLLNEQFKTSFFEFVNRHRIEEVKKLLADPDYANNTIISIAHDAGFNSKSSFNTAFKNQTGVTPSEFRKERLKT